MLKSEEKLYQQAYERSEGLCEYNGCGSNFMVQMHHIVKGSGKRTQCQRIESVIFLCYEHHHARYGVHGMDGHTIDMELKIGLQRTYESMGMNEDEVRKLLGGKLHE